MELCKLTQLQTKLIAVWARMKFFYLLRKTGCIEFKSYTPIAFVIAIVKIGYPHRAIKYDLYLTGVVYGSKNTKWKSNISRLVVITNFPLMNFACRHNGQTIHPAPDPIANFQFRHQCTVCCVVRASGSKSGFDFCFSSINCRRNKSVYSSQT